MKVIFIDLCQTAHIRRFTRGGSVAFFSIQVPGTNQREHTGFIWCLVKRPFPQLALLWLLLTRLQLSWTVCSLKSVSKTPGKANGDKQLVQMAPWAFVWVERVNGKHRGWKPREVGVTCEHVINRHLAFVPFCHVLYLFLEVDVIPTLGT